METTDVDAKLPRYFIDLEWFEQRGRSFAILAQSRMCPSCQARLGEEQEERVPTIDPGSGRVVFQVRKVAYGHNPLTVIRDCCSKEVGFIAPRTPLLEAIFRIFLASANQPLTLEEIRQRLEEWMSLGEGAPSISQETLRRLLENDRYYGLREINLPQAIDDATPLLEKGG